MTSQAQLNRLRSTYDLLILSGCDDGDFYTAANEIDPWINPRVINDEIWAATARWADAQPDGEKIE